MTTPALVKAGSAALNTGDTVSPSFGQATTSGNFLLAWVTSDDGATSYPITVSGTGWTEVDHAGGQYNWTGLYYRADCGSSESAPSFSSSGADVMVAALCEFSGVATSSPLDAKGTLSGTFPATVTTTSADTGASDLIVAVGTWNGSNADPSIGVEINSTATSIYQFGNGSSEPFYIFGGIVGPSTPNSVDSATFSLSAFENYPAAVIASFLAA